MDWLDRWITPGMTCVDVGANEGGYTKAMLRRGASVIAVEPDAEKAQQIRDGCSGATVIEAAMTDQPGTVTLYCGREALHHSLYQPAVLNPTGETRTVAAITLDSLPAMGLVKIDAQGAEGAILRGGKRTLAEVRPILYLELWQSGLTWAGDSVRAVCRQLEDARYVPDGRTWADVIADAERHQEHSAIDVLCVPQERV